MEERILVSPMPVCFSRKFPRNTANRDAVYHNQKEIKVRPQQARATFRLFPMVPFADYITSYTDVGTGREHYCG